MLGKMKPADARRARAALVAGDEQENALQRREAGKVAQAGAAEPLAIGTEDDAGAARRKAEGALGARLTVGIGQQQERRVPLRLASFSRGH